MDTLFQSIRGAGFIYVIPETPFNYLAARRMLRQMVREIQSPPDFNVLIDFRAVEMRLTFNTLFHLAVSIAAFPDVRNDRIALLTGDGTPPEEAAFFSLWSKNHGLTIEVFSSFEAAFQWFFTGNGRRMPSESAGTDSG